MTSRPRRLRTALPKPRARLLVLPLALLLVLLLAPLLAPPPAHAQRLGPGHVPVPGFSGYVTRDGAELGVGRLRDGSLGICLDTGPGLRWPAGTPAYTAVRDPRAAYLAATYLPRARRNARVAAALWWAVGGTLGLNSHPARVRAHVAALRTAAPRVYASVRAWHTRMLAAARRDAAGRRGYTTRLRLHRVDAVTARLTGIGVRSGSGHWVAGHRVRVRLSGARFASGRTTWTGTTRAGARTLTIRIPSGGKVRAHETVTGLPSPRFRRYDAGGATQRVATAAPRIRVRATARTSGAAGVSGQLPVPLRVEKTSERDDPTGLVGVAIEVRAGTADGPVVDRHTFTASDIRDGAASYTTGARYARSGRYVVVIVAEPAGWLPEATTVRAVPGGPGLVARLVDDRIWQPRLSTQVSARVVRPGVALADRVSVTDTGGDTLTGRWRLLGPVPPGAHGCSDATWSAAPVAASGAFTVTGDGTWTIGRVRVRRVGCLTYVERVEGNRTTRPVGWTTPGMETETTLVRGVPRLATAVSDRRVTAGGLVFDRVRVSGMGDGAAPLSGRWQLLGPIAPHARRGCHRLRWDHAPVAAHGTFAVRRNGRLTVGHRRLRAGGCYTYHEWLPSSPVSLGLAWTRPGLTAETALASPRQPVVPTHPTVPAGGGRPAPSHGRSLGIVTLPATRLRAVLHPVSFRGRSLTPPGDIRTAGLWAAGAGLDAVVGTTVLVGHVSDVHDRPGAFHRLWPARVGQTIVTIDARGTRTRWRITRVALTPKREVPRSLFRQRLTRRLVLVTCGNEVHYPGGGFHYRSNLIVEAVPR